MCVLLNREGRKPYGRDIGKIEEVGRGDDIRRFHQGVAQSDVDDGRLKVAASQLCGQAVWNRVDEVVDRNRSNVTSLRNH